jgi:hypothetical protein
VRGLAEMQPKYSNIFWHEGVKIFEENLLKTESGRMRIAHLENDVTKALLNLFEHCSKKVLSAFLRMINIKKSSEAFDLDFQITDSITYRQKKKKILLSITPTSFQSKSDPAYLSATSRPDACIYSEDTAILIEAKTQSPLIEEQIESHIKEYLGTNTERRRITWEEINETFNSLKKSLNEKDKFLLTQFCRFLGLIGIAEFTGYTSSDFEMIGSRDKIPKEDWLDFTRILKKKNEKFINQFRKEIEPSFKFKNFKTHNTSLWSIIYFYDDNPNIGVNEYPNLNFGLYEYGLEISVNAEIKSSIRLINRRLKNKPDEFDKIANAIKDFHFSLHYKLQFRPRALIWNLVPGFPINMTAFKSEEIISAIKAFEKGWKNYKRTLLFQMETGIIKHWSGRFFSETEIEFAKNKNPKPNFAMRIAKKYSANEIGKKGKKIFSFLKNEVLKLKKLIQFVTT